MTQNRQRASDGRIKVGFHEMPVVVDGAFFKFNPSGLPNIVNPDVDPLVPFHDFGNGLLDTEIVGDITRHPIKNTILPLSGFDRVDQALLAASDQNGCRTSIGKRTCDRQAKPG